jgi:hypothetical protein
MLDSLDIIIDEYLRFEKRERVRLGFPRQAGGTGAAGSNRSWESADELLDASVDSLRMSAMAGAMGSMSIRQDRAIRLDAANRKVGATVMRIPDLTVAETAAEIQAARALLRVLLVRRNIVL